MQPYMVNIKLSARTLTGALNSQNRGAADWGWQGLIAYGCHSLVLIIDSKTAQTLQVLERHKANVVKVKWAKENYHHNIGSPYSLRLASADATGKIIVWDVATGTARCEIQEHTKPIQDMQWLWSQDASRDLLLAVHPPNYIVLWNADTGTKLWKKSYAENILSFSFDPFDPSNLTLLTSEGIVFISDFSPSKAPISSGKKVYISSPRSSPVHNKLVSAAGAKKALDKVKILITNEKPSAESVTLNDCLQLSYLPSKRNYMLLLYPREILILDLEVNQTVGVIAIERTGVPFLQVIPCFQRDGLFCLHENGCITLRVRRSLSCINDTLNEDPDPDPIQELVYDLRSQCDAIRVTKTVRPFTMVCCPVNENSAALIVSDGRVMIWELKSSISSQSLRAGNSSAPLYSPGSFCGIPVGASQNKLPDLSLDNMIGQGTLSTEEQLKSYCLQEVHLKFLLTGLFSGLPLPPFAIRMCPPLTTKNIKQYQPLLAIGTSNGSVLVYNLTSGLLHKELSIHSCEVKGVEWTSLSGFLSFATSTPNNLGQVRNELQLVDLPTGRSIAFRGERGGDEPAIEMIKVSHLKQYLAVVFKDKPLELWDIRTCSLLREMSKNFPTITALEWSPSHNLKSLRKKQLAAREAMARQTVVSDTEQSSLESSVISLLQEAESKSELSQNISAREHFVFTDTDGQVYHLTVEGNSVKDSARIPPDGSMGSITCIAWKGDILVLGDVDGNLNFWDLKARVSRGIPTHRGWVKKIRFAPGKGNQKLIAMYNDGAEVWDTKEVQMVSSLRSGRNVNFRVLDVDWCTSDKVILASDDGCIRVLEMTMKSACFRMDEQELSEPVWCPYLLVPRASLALKTFLLHQPWNNKYSLDISQINYPESENVKNLLQEQLHSLSNDIKKLLLDPEFSLLQRCLLVSRLYGDESELHFWTVAAHYLYTFSQEKTLTVKAEDALNSQEKWINPLDICYDTLCENSYFQKFQLERVNLQEVKRSNYDHTRKCTDQLLHLGQTDRAVQLLLETSAENPYYYCDSLKACLVTTVTSSGPSQSTIKLVATNMIANGKLAEGVQLLCLIDKAADACRYLQTYGEWNRAAWLAKVRLDAEECADVLKRWVDQLCSPQINQKSKAILVLLSLGCFMRVAEMLHSMRYFDRAALFVEACLNYGTIEVNEDAKKLIHAVFADYARSLKTLGFKQAATLFASKAGSAGKDLLNELEQLKEEE
ncbi:WD repeat-containing protein 11 isoform X1 [Rhineura floridana]|uniref:WD repeat-containing protein 11 isoform X1 n=2 Tax=Rhineura floridana TaxID=261503 RepID=UPI002AC81895|nr:WD repeat-containing protein 11 isoform X1 [Rhineura floridana]XP_061491803.1 WD repeat-containing protein 11 isoform X1 [Rhineura floridana]